MAHPADSPRNGLASAILRAGHDLFCRSRALPFTLRRVAAGKGLRAAAGDRSQPRQHGQDEFLCIWKGYGPDGDTWEPKENLGEHFGKAAALNKKVEVQLDRHRYLFQEAVAKQLTSKKVKDKAAVWQKELVVHSIVDVEVAEALIASWRRPRAGHLWQVAAGIR